MLYHSVFILNRFIKAIDMKQIAIKKSSHFNQILQWALNPFHSIFFTKLLK